jgi:small subunit ribosomal protein S30e
MPTHGSLTKAGKVRSQTPKVDKTSKNNAKGPLRSNKSHYHERIIYQPKDKWNRRRRRR